MPSRPREVRVTVVGYIFRVVPYELLNAVACLLNIGGDEKPNELSKSCDDTEIFFVNCFQRNVHEGENDAEIG